MALYGYFKSITQIAVFVFQLSDNFKYFLIPGYSLITNSGSCITTKTNWPKICQIYKVALIAECEAYCTNQQSCVGYNYRHPGPVSGQWEPGVCNLYPAESTCPTSFTSPEHDLYAGFGDPTGSVNDLRPGSNNPLYECYGKTSGRNIQ